MWWKPHQPNKEKVKTILVVDDTDIARLGMVGLLSRANIVYSASSVTEALEALEDHPEINLVVSDLEMPGMTGLDLFEEMNARALTAEKWLCSGNIPPEMVKTIVELGATEILSKTEIIDAAKRHGLLKPAKSEPYVA